MSSRYLTSGGRYPVLRALALLYLIGAAVAVVAGILGTIWALAWAPDTAGHRVILALGVLAGTFFVTISMLAVAEVLKLFMDIEHNSRMIRLVYSVGSTLAASTNASTSSSNLTVSATRLADLDEETAEGALIRGH